MCIPCTDICPKGNPEGATSFYQLPECAGIMKIVGCKQFNTLNVHFRLTLKSQNYRKAKRNMLKLQKNAEKHLVIRRNSDIHIIGRKGPYKLPPSSWKMAVQPSVLQPDMQNYLVFSPCPYTDEDLKCPSICPKLIGSMALVQCLIKFKMEGNESLSQSYQQVYFM